MAEYNKILMSYISGEQQIPTIHKLKKKKNRWTELNTDITEG
jgi:hypothetical protein